METNAAKELLAILEEWEPLDGEGVVRQRDPDSGGSYTEELWRQQARAVSLLLEVEAFSRKIGEYENDFDLFNELRNVVWAPSVVWKRTDYVLGVSGLAMSSLRKLGMLMRSSPQNVRLVDAEVVALRGAIEKCLDLLGVAPAGVEEHREHLRYLLKRCLDILDREPVDLVALHDISFNVVGEAFSNEALWKWDQSAEFFQNVAVIARSWGPKVAFGASVSATSTLLIEGAKVAASLAGSVIRGEIEPPK